MSKARQAKLPSKIYTEAIVRSVSGESLLHSSTPVTCENVTQFYAEPRLLDSAVNRLKAEGFEILNVSKTSISIAADAEVYERSLQTTLEAVERPVIKEIVGETTATFINARDDKPFGEIDTSQTSWDQLLDGIAINEPAFYFRPQISLDSPLETTRKYLRESPPETTTKYLRVPEDIAQGLNATLAHQQGITGRGVKVVMVDTGWYRHPFFTKHNYKVNVVLAPGSSAPLEDENGHGTGESANLLAVAPDVELTMVKADVLTNPGKFKNVNSVAAFKKAVSLRPDIITCSWGCDLSDHKLSPFNQALASAIADAVRQGIIVIFASGNGQWSFPSQHPDVISVGGVYQHLDGLLKGQLEASNYASSFISQIYQGRRVPDVCGLVGQLPYGAYIMLPVPPGSQKDQEHSSVGDGTKPTDGWAAFSGTSAAAPQLAGICALMKQLDSGLSPAKVKEILQHTARDVVEGSSHPSTGGYQAHQGPDLATGYGLADAYASIEEVKNVVWGMRFDDSALSLSHPPQLAKKQLLDISTTRRQKMPSDFPKLKAKLDEILWEIEQILEERIKNNEIEDVELIVSEVDFVPRSVIAKSIYLLRQSLEDCWKKEEEKNIRGQVVKVHKSLESSKIFLQHISIAQGLIKFGKYQETAIQVLTEALKSHNDTVRDAAIKALSECVSNINSFDHASRYDISEDRVDLYNQLKITLCKKEHNIKEKICTVDNNIAYCSDGNSTKEYEKVNECWRLR
ncbi:peptidase S8 [Nostoc sp. CENA543]|uniref:S8 family serine peptidase n=1 Tax=Nostoc sp. CENA543 TaxID=1869241 RepID=UPI000CA18982|nr:S8 family serine peptidase [Nostoc sp. CENA543]AUT00813.1 peptidase S8 [Nostoc sp. CENA543]